MVKSKQEIKDRIRDLEWKYLHTMSVRAQLRIISKIEILKWVLGEEV